MTTEIILHILLSVTAIVVSSLLALYAWLRHGKPGVATFAVMMAFVMLWTITTSLRVLSATYEAALFWFNCTFLSLAVVPVLYFIFIVQYSGRQKWLNTKRIFFLFIIPCLTQIFVWTNSSHHLFMRSVFFDSSQGLMQWAEIKGGPVFFAYMVYTYGLLLFGLGLALAIILRNRNLYRRQAFFLLLGTLPPLSVNIIRTFGLIPGLRESLTPIAFTLSGLIFAYDLFHYRFLDIIPIARETVIDSMQDGMLIVDENDRIVDVNPSMQAVLEKSKQMLIGKPLEEVLQAHPGWLRHFQAVENRAEISSDGDGKLIHYDLHVSPLRDRRGRMTGRLILLRDITSRKLSENALHQSNLELQSRNEELDAFSHTVAHDLKNPLSTIVLYSASLEKEYGELSKKEITSRLAGITRMSFRMSSIIDELLLLSSVRKEGEIILLPLDMGSIVSNALERLAVLIADHKAKITIPDSWPVAIGRGQWVEEVWANYISNAVKYGGKPPRVRLGAEPNDGGTIRFWVKDNGDGLSRQEQSRLFTPFTQLKQADLKGHGLGLSIVKRIIDRMDGQVGLESEGLPGKGCVFSFTLPAWSKQEDVDCTS